MITIVNCARTPCTHYCGRESSYHKALVGPDGPPVDLSILGNPFWMRSELERDEVVARYRIHLWNRIKPGPLQDKEALKALESIPDDAILGCFCAPRACHCDVIKDAAEWLRAENTKSGKP